MNICEADIIEPAPNAFQRVVRRYRLLEFGSAVVLLLLALLFAEIEVHERPIPAIKVRLSATATAWALDPSIDETKLSEQGESIVIFYCWLNNEVREEVYND